MKDGPSSIQYCIVQIIEHIGQQIPLILLCPVLEAEVGRSPRNVKSKIIRNDVFHID